MFFFICFLFYLVGFFFCLIAVCLFVNLLLETILFLKAKEIKSELQLSYVSISSFARIPSRKRYKTQSAQLLNILLAGTVSQFGF